MRFWGVKSSRIAVASQRGEESGFNVSSVSQQHVISTDLKQAGRNLYVISTDLEAVGRKIESSACMSLALHYEYSK